MNPSSESGSSLLHHKIPQFTLQKKKLIICLKLLQQLTEISRRISCILPVKLCMKNNTCPAFFSPCLSRIPSALLACRGTENWELLYAPKKKIPPFPQVHFDIPWKNFFSPHHRCFSFQVLEPQVSRNVDNSILALSGFQPGPLAIYRPTIQQMSYRKSFEDLHFSTPVTTGTRNSFLFSSYPRGILFGQSQIFASKSSSEWADSHREKAAASPQFTFLLFSPPKFSSIQFLFTPHLGLGNPFSL